VVQLERRNGERRVTDVQLLSADRSRSHAPSEVAA
jgi:hypothetical protein